MDYDCVIWGGFLETITDKIGTESSTQDLFEEFCHRYCVMLFFSKFSHVHCKIGKLNQDKGSIDAAIENYLEAIRQVHITLILVYLHFPLTIKMNMVILTHLKSSVFLLFDYCDFNFQMNLGYRGFNTNSFA